MENTNKIGNKIYLNILLRCYSVMQVQKKVNLHLSNWHIDKTSYGEGDQINAAKHICEPFFVVISLIAFLPFVAISRFHLHNLRTLTNLEAVSNLVMIECFNIHNCITSCNLNNLPCMYKKV